MTTMAAEGAVSSDRAELFKRMAGVSSPRMPFRFYSSPNSNRLRLGARVPMSLLAK
jgi:hypothetical protein